MTKDPLLNENIFEKERGIFMGANETYSEINGYLDLYLLAGSLGDKQWQEELLVQLQKVQMKQNEDPTLTINNLWEEYKMINIELLDLYNQLRNQSPNRALHKKVRELKQERMSIRRKIHDIEHKLKQHHS
jgi:hypothetical protein